MKLTYRGNQIEIDDDDWVRVKEHNWYLTKDGMRTRFRGANILLARFIMNARLDEIVTFGQRGRNCYCKSNLTVLRRSDFAFQARASAHRGIYKTPRGRYAVKLGGKYLGTFDKIEQATQVYVSAYTKKYGESPDKGNLCNQKSQN